MGRRSGGGGRRKESRGGIMNRVIEFIKFSEFEIFFILFFLIVFFLFRDLMARPEYNGILVKKPAALDLWPY